MTYISHQPRFAATELTVLAGLYALWLVSYPVIMFLMAGSGMIAGAIGFVLGLGICLLHLVIRPSGDIPTAVPVYTYIGLFGMVILLSQLFGNEAVDIGSITQTAVMIAVLFIAALIANNPVLLARIFRFYALFITMLLVIVYVDGDVVWGRLVGRGQPNFWGMMAQTAVFTGLLLATWKTRAVVWGAAALILYATNSRASMVCVAAGLGTVAICMIVTGNYGRKFKIFTSVLVALAVIAWAELQFGFVSGQLLRVDDPHRGMHTGFTGRLDPWLYGIAQGLERPFFGYGYRESEALFGDIGVSSVHNGYLSMWLDTGIFGLMVYVVFLGHAIIRGVQLWRSPVVRACLAMVVGYTVLGFAERYALNAGQPLSILALACAFLILQTPKQARPERAALQTERGARLRKA
jgi:O-antigen ligase